MPIKYRSATEADIPAIARVGNLAFDPATNPLARNLFPPHLKQPGIDAPNAWRISRKVPRFRDDPNSFFLVAVDSSSDDDCEEDQIVGWSWWTTPIDPTQEKKPFVPPEEKLLPGIDQDARERVRSCLITATKSVFGDNSATDYYELQILAVDPKYGRQGIGGRLVQWGLDRGANEGKDVFLIATTMGKPLYKKLGFLEFEAINVFEDSVLTPMIFKNDPSTKIMGGKIVPSS